MDILNILKRLRDDIKLWVINNINVLNAKIDSKLDYNDLSDAIDNAIAQADLKGEKGDDGISVTHSWNGTTLVVTSASGTSSTDLKGEAGYVPIRGTDYWTETDKAEIKSYVDEAILGGAW